MQEGFQLSVVGKTAVPRYSLRSKWRFLTSKLDELRDGQAVRLVIPKGAAKNGALGALHRYAFKKKVYGHFRTEKKTDGSVILYLWCSEKKEN